MTVIQLKHFIYQHKKNFLSFLFVGLVTGIVYFSLFVFLSKKLLLNYNIAVSIAYFIAIIFYFFMHRHFTFKSQSHSLGTQAGKFMGMIAFNYIVTLGVVHSTVEVLRVSPYIGMVLGIGATTIMGYIIAKFWVFQVKNQGEI